MVYVGLVLFALFVMFAVIVVIRRSMFGSAKNERGTFTTGMSIADISAMKQDGLLTDEEAAAVRATVARRVKEKMEYDEQLKAQREKGPVSLEAALAQAIVAKDKKPEPEPQPQPQMPLHEEE